MENLIIISIGLLLVINIITLAILLRKRTSENSDITDSLKPLQEEIARLSNGLKEEFRISRTENADSAKANREELNRQIAAFRTETTDAIRALNDKNVEALQKLNSTMEQRILALIDKTENSFKSFSDGNAKYLEKIEKQVEGKLQTMNEQSKVDSQQMRESLSSAFKEFQEVFDKNVKSFNDLQREKFSQLETRQNELVNATEKKLDSIRNTVEEKLEKTLSERLGQSFETVGKQLMEVQRGLGEMQNLAQDVGGLKKVLSNVKMRGGIGEVQLSMLLEQILAPEQYQANVKTKKGEDSIVEFAIKLPGRESNEPVWLPVDAKFPRDKYEQLQDAYDSGDITRIQLAQKYLEEFLIRAPRLPHPRRASAHLHPSPPAKQHRGGAPNPFEWHRWRRGRLARQVERLGSSGGATLRRTGRAGEGLPLQSQVPRYVRGSSVAPSEADQR